MKVFKEKAYRFTATFANFDGNPEIVHTYEPDEADNEVECWAVYFNPPKMKR